MHPSLDSSLTMDKFIDIHVELHELQATSGSLAAETNDRGEPSCDTEVDSKPMSTTSTEVVGDNSGDDDDDD